MYPALRPDQIEAVVKEDYNVYIDELYRAWFAAKHPDVDKDGRPKRRNLSTEGRAEQMHSRLGDVAHLVNAMAWHNDCCSPRSSQALLVEVLGNLQTLNALQFVTESFSEAQPYQIEFEQQAGRTVFDSIIRDAAGGVIATVEATFAEPGFRACDYPMERCDGTWWSRPNVHMGCPMAVTPENRVYAERYWRIAQEDWNVPTVPPEEPTICPLWAAYQASHNMAETRRLGESAYWLLLYDERNPYFTNEQVGWVPKLRATGPRNWHAISWQQLLHKAEETVPQLHHLRTLHGF